MLAHVPWAWIEAARFIGAACAVGALLGIVTSIVKAVRRG